MRIFAIPFEEISCTRDLKRKSEGLFIGVWRSWLAHLVWDQRVLCSSHSTPTYERLSVWMTSFFVYGPVCMRCRRRVRLNVKRVPAQVSFKVCLYRLYLIQSNTKTRSRLISGGIGSRIGRGPTSVGRTVVISLLLVYNTQYLFVRAE